MSKRLNWNKQKVFQITNWDLAIVKKMNMSKICAKEQPMVYLPFTHQKNQGKNPYAWGNLESFLWEKYYHFINSLQIFSLQFLTSITLSSLYSHIYQKFTFIWRLYSLICTSKYHINFRYVNISTFGSSL